MLKITACRLKITKGIYKWSVSPATPHAHKERLNKSYRFFSNTLGNGFLVSKYNLDLKVYHSIHKCYLCTECNTSINYAKWNLIL